MKIVIDLTSLSYHLTGIERYAMCVADKLIDIDQDNEYILLFRNEVAEIFKSRINGKRIKAVVLYGNNKLFFLQITLTRELRKIKANKYLFLAFPSPFLFAGKGMINTIHDMGAWDSAQEAQTLHKYYFRILYRRAARKSEKIITVSNFSKGRICKILGVDPERLTVVYSAVYDNLLKNNNTSFDYVKENYNLPEKYIMTLSTLEPRKNMKLLLEAYDNISKEVNYDLVLVGRKGWKVDDLIDRYKAKNRIHITGFVQDEHIAAIYKNAICFVFTSLYEGFGLPPVEALAMGTPVISSDAASLPEVLMDQALYFKNNSMDELESLLLSVEDRIADMPHSLNDTQIKQYSFLTAAQRVLDILTETKCNKEE